MSSLAPDDELFVPMAPPSNGARANGDADLDARRGARFWFGPEGWTRDDAEEEFVLA